MDGFAELLGVLDRVCLGLVDEIAEVLFSDKGYDGSA